MDGAGLVERLQACQDALRLNLLESKALGSSTKISHWCLDVALYIGLLTSCSLDHSVEWLMQDSRRGTKLPHHLAREDVKRIVEDAFLALPDSVLNNWADPVTRSFSRTVVIAAEQYVRDFNLASHVHKANKSKGRTLESRVLPGLANALHDEAVVGPIARPVNAVSDLAVRAWGKRWRRRVGARMGTLGSREEVPTETLRKKDSVGMGNVTEFQGPWVRKLCIERAQKTALRGCDFGDPWRQLVWQRRARNRAGNVGWNPGPISAPQGRNG